MATTVKVTAHDFPCLVEVYNEGTKDGVTQFLMMDGASREFVVTDTQSLHVAELDAQIVPAPAIPSDMRVD
jgi:hypothetical protein